MTPRKLKTFMLRVARLAICAILCCGVGCQSAATRRAESLEAKLRDQQSSIDRLTVSLEQVEADRDVARREASILRDELAKLQPSPEILQTSHSAARVDRIEVVPLLSGGLDRDEVLGDEQVSLLIAPKDSRGEIHRVPGVISIRLTDYSRPAGSEEIAAASFDEVQTEPLWQNGIVGRGYRVIVPLPEDSTSRNIAAHVRFTTNAGTQLDTLYQLAVTPPAGGSVDSGGD